MTLVNTLAGPPDLTVRRNPTFDDHEYRMRRNLPGREVPYFPGLDLGYKARTEARELEQLKDGQLRIVRVPGCAQWSGLGSQTYYPTYYLLLELAPATYGSEGRALVVRRAWEVTPGSRWRAGIEALRAFARREYRERESED